MSRINPLILLLLVAGLVLSCKDPKDPVTPPAPVVPTGPNLFTIVSVTQYSMNLTWNDRSEDEDGFKVQVYIESESAWFTQANVAAHAGIGTVTYELTNLSPGTVYRLRVVAWNAAGESAPSNEQQRSTTAAPLPRAPSDVQAVALAAVTVRVTWQDNDVVDAFVIQRHVAGGQWADLATVGDAVVVYTDNTVSAETTYYYRVGAQNENGIAWSADSAVVTTPAPGAPLAPDSLVAEVVIGRRVILHWLDRAVNETGFELQRAPYGQQFQPLAMLGPDVTQYNDELGTNPDVYNYQLRAYNGIGSSGWVRITVDYRYCSDGLIPLCEGNTWDYVVSDTVGEDYEIRVQSLRPEFIDDLDWYGIRSIRTGTPDVDTLYYWRNIDDTGTFQLDYPAPVPAAGNLLYRWPAALGSYTVINGDSVQLVSTGTTVLGRTEAGEDTAFTNCLAYEHRYHGSDRYDQVFIHPNDIGVVQLKQYVRGIGVVAVRDLIRWHIQN
ncbi:fibronectin type III domain-containing protein [candidate division KSB1 bacterium]|nr:fibronectin type III domain-containing protein [candidate division KSB1 bacterium]